MMIRISLGTEWGISSIKACQVELGIWPIYGPCMVDITHMFSFTGKNYAFVFDNFSLYGKHRIHEAFEITNGELTLPKSNIIYI